MLLTLCVDAIGSLNSLPRLDIKTGLRYGFHYLLRNDVFAFHGQDFVGVVGVDVPLLYGGFRIQKRRDSAQAVGAVDAGLEF